MIAMLNKTILFIADHLKGGGAERILLEAATLLAENNSVIIALLDSNDIRMEVPQNIRIINLDINQKFMTGGLWRRGNRNLTQKEIEIINSHIKTLEPDLIILTHCYAFHVLPYISGNIWLWVHYEIFNPVRQKVKNIFRWYKETRRLYHELKYFPQLLDAKKVIFVNHDFQKICYDYIPLATTKVIYNGVKIDPDEILNPETNIKKWDCIFVGRLSSEKQPDYALIAFSKSNLKGRMAIVGDGRMMDELKYLANSLGIADRVDFLGWQSDVKPYIKQSHVSLMTSNSEGYGLVISESLVLDTPVVAFNCSDGVSFQLESGALSQGLVPPQNMEKLIETINHIYHSPYVITQHDKDRLSINRMISDFDELIN